MRLALILTAAVTLTLLCRLAPAQVPGDPVAAEDLATLRQRVEMFFEDFSSDPKQAIGDFVAGSSLAEKREELTRLQDQAEKLEDRYGNISDHEQVAEKNYGKDLVVLRYLLKAEKFPIVWHFYFYRSGNNGMLVGGRPWTLIELRFDTDLRALER